MTNLTHIVYISCNFQDISSSIRDSTRKKVKLGPILPARSPIRGIPYWTCNAARICRFPRDAYVNAKPANLSVQKIDKAAQSVFGT